MSSLSAQSFTHLTVIGLGLIGGSVAMAVKERFPEVWITGVDPDAASLQYGLKYGFVDQASLTLPDTFSGVHLVVIACHLQNSLVVLKTLADQISPSDTVLITDVGSCKAEIATLGQQVLPRQFIAGHPMAGKEFSGVQHATSLLFTGKSYFLCPHNQTPPERLDCLSDFILGLGAIPRTLDAARHDKYMAYVSHLPQLNSVLIARLMHQNEPGHLVSCHGAGLDGQLRLAASPYAMWQDIFQMNAAPVEAMLDELQALIDEVKPLLKKEEGLKEWFQIANLMHEAFQKGRG
jgi:prephenate dehydrogenase